MADPDLLTLIDFTEDNDARESGMRIAGNGRMKEEDTFKKHSVEDINGGKWFHTHCSLTIRFGGYIFVGLLYQHVERLLCPSQWYDEVADILCNVNEDGTMDEERSRPETLKRKSEGGS